MTQKSEEQKRIDRNHWKLAAKMIKRVRHSKPHNTIFLFFLYLFLVAAILIFYGDFKKNLDFTKAKDYADRTYHNGSETRISVRKSDNGSFSEEELEKIRAMRYVRMVDEYDILNDVYFADVENEDYNYNYRVCQGRTFPPDSVTVKILKQDKFIRTVSCLKEKDLTAGNLPENRYDIVIQSSDKSLLGTTHKVYLSDKNYWQRENVCLNMTITGITKEGDEGQIYISETLAGELQLSLQKLKDCNFYGLYYINPDYENMRGLMQDCPLEEGMVETDIGQMNKETLSRPLFLINEELTGRNVWMSANFYDNAFIKGMTYIQYLVQDGSMIAYGDSYDRQVVNTIILPGETEHSAQVVEVSKELFYQIYGEKKSNQLSVYMKDYAYTDRVLQKLKKEGYEAVSVFRVGTTEYSEDKVAEQVNILMIDLGALLIVFVIGIFLIDKMIRMREKDYRIMILLGLNRSILNRMNGLDICYNAVLALFVTIVSVNIAMYLDMPYVAAALRYCGFWDYVLYSVVVFFMMFFLYRKTCKTKKKRKKAEVV